MNAVIEALEFLRKNEKYNFNGMTLKNIKEALIELGNNKLAKRIKPYEAK